MSLIFWINRFLGTLKKRFYNFSSTNVENDFYNLSAGHLIDASLIYLNPRAAVSMLNANNAFHEVSPVDNLKPKNAPSGFGRAGFYLLVTKNGLEIFKHVMPMCNSRPGSPDKFATKRQMEEESLQKIVSSPLLPTDQFCFSCN